MNPASHPLRQFPLPTTLMFSIGLLLSAATAWADAPPDDDDDLIPRTTATIDTDPQAAEARDWIKSPAEYEAFKQRRLAIAYWLRDMGIIGVHSIHPTYNGGGDLYGRDVQLLKDASVEGGISNNEFANRQAMSAIGTAKLLALLATDRALSPENSAIVRKRMRRDPNKQPYQWRRITGGAVRTKGVEVYSKTGTWGPIYADAGIVHGADGRQFTLAIYIDSTPAYRGSFIAELSKRLTRHLLGD